MDHFDIDLADDFELTIDQSDVTAACLRDCLRSLASPRLDSEERDALVTLAKGYILELRGELDDRELNHMDIELGILASAFE